MLNPGLRLVHDASSAPLPVAQVLLSDEAVAVLPSPVARVHAASGAPLVLEVQVRRGETAPGEHFTVTLRSRLGPFQEPDRVVQTGPIRQFYAMPGPGRHDLVYDVAVEHWVRGRRGRRLLRRQEFVGTMPVFVDEDGQ